MTITLNDAQARLLCVKSGVASARSSNAVPKCGGGTRTERSQFGLTLDSANSPIGRLRKCKCLKRFGGLGEIRTHDLFHAI
jgi:hypothetical protein